MLGDIAIMVFALIAIFTGKKWAIVTATIWLIVAFVLGIATGFGDSSLTDPNLVNGLDDTGAALSDEALDDITFTDEEKTSFVLAFFELLFIIIGWIRVIFTKKKSQNLTKSE